MVDDEADSIVMVEAAQAAPEQAADTEEPGVLLRRMRFRFEEETA
jgi:hypothetical protein